MTRMHALPLLLLLLPLLASAAAALAAAESAPAAAAAAALPPTAARNASSSAVQPQHQQQKQKQQKQHQLDAFLGLLAAANAPRIDAVARLQSARTPTLPAPLRRAGLSYVGAAGRLRRVLAKLANGERTRVAALGGAVTAGAGLPPPTTATQQQATTRRGGGGGASDLDLHKNPGGWFEQTVDYLRAAFPNAEIDAHNGAAAGARSELAGVCLERLLGGVREPDLVFVEFAGADGYLDASVNNARVAALERLLRRLLRLPSRPAVVLVSALPPGLAAAAADDRAAGNATGSTRPPSREGRPGGWQPLPLRFYESAEDHVSVLGQYYGLPCLSLRDAVWHAAARRADGFRPEQLFAVAAAAPAGSASDDDDGEDGDDTGSDGSSGGGGGNSHSRQQHPGRRRRRRRRRRLHTAPQEQQQQQQPRRPRRRPQRRHHASALAHTYLADLAAALLRRVHQDSLLAPLPPGDAAQAERVPDAPMLPHNHEGQGGGCAGGLDLRALVPPDAPPQSRGGFYWANDAGSGGGGSAARPRWGWVSTVPGSRLELTLDTRAFGAAAMPRLTLPQKLAMLHAHGMYAAAAALLAEEQGLGGGSSATAAAAASLQAAFGAAVTPALPGALLDDPQQPLGAPVAAASAAGGDGLAAAAAEAERQAAAALARLRVGALQPFARGERVVGGAGGFALPENVRDVVAAGFKTTSGVEVVVGRRLLGQEQDQPQQQQQQQQDHQPQHQQHEQRRRRRRLLRLWPWGGAAPVPPPPDAVHLRPGVDTKAAIAMGPGGYAVSGGSSGGGSSSSGGMVVYLGYATAPRGMGRARATCGGGCRCEPRVLDGHTTRPRARAVLAPLRVTEAADCRVAIEVLRETSSGGHKFRLTGVVVARAVAYDDHDHEHDDGDDDSVVPSDEQQQSQQQSQQHHHHLDAAMVGAGEGHPIVGLPAPPGAGRPGLALGDDRGGGGGT